MAVDKSLVSGSTTMLLLRLLSEKDMYGYEMIEVLQQRSNHVFDLKAGTLYPLLHGMEARNQLLSYEKEAAGKVRRYYQITKEGRKELERKKKEWEVYSTAVSQVIVTNSTAKILQPYPLRTFQKIKQFVKGLINMPDWNWRGEDIYGA